MAQNYVLLERIELNASAASVTFSNIPQTGYTDLKIVYSARSDAATTDRGMFVRFNGDTGSNYTYKFVRGDGSSAGSGGTTTTFLYFGNFDAATSTSNTFGNGEFYIPNYTGSTQKSVSSDSVSENNATGAWATLASGLWSGTSAISTILLYPEGGSFVSGSTFSLYGIAAVGTTPVVAPKAEGGNVIGTDGTYWWHIFNSSGTFTPSVGITCDYLVVAGGGGAGGNGGAGAGAGGFRTATSQTLTTTGYTVTVGAGGTSSLNYKGTNGNNSTFNSLTSAGGGASSGVFASGGTDANDGGSGGGGNYNKYVGLGNVPSTSPSQGNNGGGSTTSGSLGTGGGGGAGAVGVTGTGSASGAGGAGTANSYSGTSVTYAGGGGGGGGFGATPGAGGAGGGGAGVTSGDGVSGTANTGGGGGGGAATGGFGGSGIVIIRYAV